VFFTGTRVTGLIDCDQVTWGDRLLDLAYGAVSHPDPALGAWLGAEEVVRLVRRYDGLVGLTGAERRFLPAALVFAALEQLAETASFLGSDRANVGAADVKRATRLLDRLASRFVHTA
jgi:aminoglycoside phosphotransferase (APT) family kinase protein